MALWIYFTMVEGRVLPPWLASGRLHRVYKTYGVPRWPRLRWRLDDETRKAWPHDTHTSCFSALLPGLERAVERTPHRTAVIVFSHSVRLPTRQRDIVLSFLITTFNKVYNIFTDSRDGDHFYFIWMCLRGVTGDSPDIVNGDSIRSLHWGTLLQDTADRLDTPAGVFSFGEWGHIGGLLEDRKISRH